MKTQAPTLRHLVVPVAFALAAVVLSLVIWRSFGGPVPLQAKGYEIAVRLPDAADLYVGSDVDMSGVKIGRVVNIDQAGGAAKLRLELKPQYAPLRSGARAIKRTKSLLGEGYIDMSPGPVTATIIPDGGQLPYANVDDAQGLDDVLETFSPGARKDFQHLFAGMSVAFAGASPALNDALGHAGPITDNLATVFETLNRQNQNLGHVFASSADVLNAVAGREAVLQAAVTSGNEVLGATARSRRGIAATIRALPPFLAELHRASGTIGAATTDLNGATAALTPVAPLVQPALAAVRGATPQFTGLFRELPSALTAGVRGLPAANRTIRAAGKAFGTIYPFSREAIPFLQLLGQLRGSLASFFANIGQMTNTQVPAAGGGTQSAILGVPSIWNETLAGWKVRLPSSRPNPYPKPGAAEEIGHGGLLAYDCTHLGNPLYVPTTGGTGAPPCRLQGPWTFNGVSRYYPHLTLAPK